LIFLAMAGVSDTFCSWSFHPIRCDFVAAFSGRTALAAALAEALRGAWRQLWQYELEKALRAGARTAS
jgi:hypothetical protein